MRLAVPRLCRLMKQLTTAGLSGLLVAVAAALVLFPGADGPLLDPTEGRQAEIAREMWVTGDWLVPRLGGEAYYEKPPLHYWLTAAGYAAWGATEWTARLTSMASAWLTVMLTYLWGRRMLGHAAGLAAALGLCLTPGFVLVSRMALPDNLFTTCVVAAWYAGAAALRGGGLRLGWWIASALACGLGLLTKGPVALVLTVPPLLAYPLLTGAAQRFRPWALLAYGSMALAVALPWYGAMLWHEPAFAERFLWRSNFVRYVQPYIHSQPWWYYLPVLCASTFPLSLLWTFLVRSLLARDSRTDGAARAALTFCILAFAWCVLFFSLSGSKLAYYILPVLPPLALLSGTFVARLFLTVSRDAFESFAYRVVPHVAITLILLITAGTCVGAYKQGWLPSAWAIGMTGATVTLVLLWWFAVRRNAPPLAWAVCAGATLAAILVLTHPLIASYVGRRSPAAVAHKLPAMTDTDPRALVSFGRQWPSALFYFRRYAVGFYEADDLASFVRFLRAYPDSIALVEDGPLLDQLLAAWPESLSAEVIRPDQPGQVAVVFVSKRSSEPTAGAEEAEER